MKTTMEIPEKLFRQAKALAAMQGISLREFFLRGLRLAIQTPPAHFTRERVDFPVIRLSQPAPHLTDEQVAAALDTNEDLI